MTKEEALTIVCEAAGKWADEIVTYVAPDATTQADQYQLEAEADRIGEALRTLSTGGPL